MPEEAPNAAYLAAATTAGIVVRGSDVGVLAPVATSDGLVSCPVKRTRPEVAADKAHQKLETKRKRGEKRDAHARGVMKKAARARRRSANRRRTRAYQDAALVARGNGDGAGHPFLREHEAAAGREPAALVAMERRTVERGVVRRNALDRKTDLEAWKRRRARAMCRRIAETGMNLRIRWVAGLCHRSGALSAEVEPRGTTRECSGCAADVPKDLGERTHTCPHCGLVMDRDVNAGVNAIGRALRRFRTTADPGDHIAVLAAAHAKQAEKRRAKLARLSKGGHARAAKLLAKRA